MKKAISGWKYSQVHKYLDTIFLLFTAKVDIKSNNYDLIVVQTLIFNSRGSIKLYHLENKTMFMQISLFSEAEIHSSL